VSVTEQLANFLVKTRFEDIPEEARVLSKGFFLDCLGTTIAGYEEEAGRIITKFIEEMGGTPESRLVGSGLLTSSLNAALANGTMAHVLDFDDTGFSHPTACILPVLLALGDKSRLSGEEVLTAQVVGYECFGKMAYGGRAYEAILRRRGYHPTPIWGTMAAAAAAAKLLNLDKNETRMALGMAGSQAAGLVENFGTMTKGFHCGNAARAGVLSAILVERGYKASLTVIEGDHGLYQTVLGEGNYDLTKVVGNLGESWEIVSPGLGMKQYPCCGGSLRAIDAILHIIRENRVSYDQVDSVEVEMNPQLRDLLRFVRPTVGYEAKFSLEYILAASIMDGVVNIDSFSDEKVNSKEMREAIDKVKVVVRKDWASSDWRGHTPVTVKMKDGSVNRNLVKNFRGHPKNPLENEEIFEKFRYCASRTLPKEKIETCITLVMELEDIKDISNLMDAVTVS
jgi:2-methylcitrate dehydratase PrpD